MTITVYKKIFRSKFLKKQMEFLNAMKTYPFGKFFLKSDSVQLSFACDELRSTLSTVNIC